ncbi:MAG: MATE family efflux transporter [Calditrichaeota bacterium]|nr:MAG: MATE family efflux transporter [Calditrichota bacterium]
MAVCMLLEAPRGAGPIESKAGSGICTAFLKRWDGRPIPGCCWIRSWIMRLYFMQPICGMPWWKMNDRVEERGFDRTLVEGPILKAVWKLAWPTMLQNILAGLQGIIDHTMVGHLVGYVGNAAIGVSWQIFLVVVVFVSSLYSGMGVMVARFAGANEKQKVNRVVYQALLTSILLACGILAPLGYMLAPRLLDLVHAAPAVKAEALPYLRIMFVFSIGKLLFFMLGGALRAAGDAHTPLRLGVGMTVLNIIFNVILIPGLGPLPAFGTTGAAIGTVMAAGLMGLAGFYLLFSGKLVVNLSFKQKLLPDLRVIAALFRFGLPTGFQGIAVNTAGVLLLRFIGSLPQSAAAQAAYTVGYTELFSLITWTSVGLLGATAAVAGQNLGAGKPERTKKAVHAAAKIGLTLATGIGIFYFMWPEFFYGIFGLARNPEVLKFGVQLLRYLSISGLFITIALTYTGGLQGTGDTRSPMYISIISQIIIPIGLCYFFQGTRGLTASIIWLAIVIGHFFRFVLSVLVFNRGKWAKIKVEIAQ